MTVIPDDANRFTVSDFLGLDDGDRDLVRGWLAAHGINPKDVAEIWLLSPHLVSIVRWQRPLKVVDGELVTTVPLTMQVQVPFPVKVQP